MSERRPLSLPLVLLPLVACHAALLATWDLAARPIATLLLLAAAALALVWAWHALRGREISARRVLAVAGLLRAFLLPLPPSLSDDVFRYVWDGEMVNAGVNPYLHAPSSPAVADPRDALWRRLPHRDVPTVYPPLALALFSIAARLPAPVWALKLLLTLADLATCGLLLGIARRLEIPASRTIWYAWSPLVALEVAGMGHVDALGVVAVAATVALLLARPPRPLAAALAALGAVLAKLVPLLALPFWARASRRPLAFGALSGGLLLAVSAGVGAATGGVPPGLVTYGVSWEFNGPLFEPLWRLLAWLDSRTAVAALLDRLKLWQGDHELWNRFYPFNYPQLHAKLLLGAALLAALALAWRRRHEPVAATGRVFGTLLLCSATVYPWYLLWVLPWAALRLRWPYLVLSFTLPLSYLPQTSGPPLLPWVFLAVWIPFALTWMLEPRWSTG